jgi:hypothetical protein
MRNYLRYSAFQVSAKNVGRQKKWIALEGLRTMDSMIAESAGSGSLAQPEFRAMSSSALRIVRRVAAHDRLGRLLHDRPSPSRLSL